MPSRAPRRIASSLVFGGVCSWHEEGGEFAGAVFEGTFFAVSLAGGAAWYATQLCGMGAGKFTRGPSMTPAQRESMRARRSPERHPTSSSRQCLRLARCRPSRRAAPARTCWASTRPVQPARHALGSGTLAHRRIFAPVTETTVSPLGSTRTRTSTRRRCRSSAGTRPRGLRGRRVPTESAPTPRAAHWLRPSGPENCATALSLLHSTPRRDSRRPSRQRPDQRASATSAAVLRRSATPARPCATSSEPSWRAPPRAQPVRVS